VNELTFLLFFNIDVIQDTYMKTFGRDFELCSCLTSLLQLNSKDIHCADAYMYTEMRLRLVEIPLFAKW